VGQFSVIRLTRRWGKLYVNEGIGSDDFKLSPRQSVLNRMDDLTRFFGELRADYLDDGVLPMKRFEVSAKHFTKSFAADDGNLALFL
jgi:hypothetical protein